MSTLEADIQEILHEWYTPKAARILKEMGVLERNWMLLALHSGVADGRHWSLRDLADITDPTILHVRVWQVVSKTEKWLREYIVARRDRLVSGRVV